MDEHQSSAPAHPPSDQKPTKLDDLLEAHYSCLAPGEDDLRHARPWVSRSAASSRSACSASAASSVARPTSREPTGPGSYGALASLLPYPVDRGLSASSPRFFS